MSTEGSGPRSRARRGAAWFRRPLALGIVAVLLAVLGVSTIGYALGRTDPDHPPVAAGSRDSSAGVPDPVLPAATASPSVASRPARTSAAPTSPAPTVPPPLPAATVVPLLPATAARPTVRPTAHRTPPPARSAAPVRPAPEPTRTRTQAPTTQAPRTLPAPLSSSTPVRVVVGRIGVDRRPIALGLTKAGALAVPDNAQDLGWYTGGPTPGAMGAAVIAGHVSYNVPGVFYRLATLTRGDTIRVTRRDGKTAVFTVSGVRSYPKNQFPTADVYGFVDRAALRLITCGGDYDARTRHFEDNIVVYADMTSVEG